MLPIPLERALDELSLSIERLNARYEGYFSRGDESEPTSLRQDVDQRIAVLMSQNLTGAARIRLNTLLRRYDSLQQTWESRARRRRGPSIAPRPLFAQAQVIRRFVTPPLGTPAPAPDPSRTTPNFRAPALRDGAATVTDLRSPQELRTFAAASGVTMERVREIHARLRTAAPIGGRGVSLERLAKTMRETEAKLLAEHGDRLVTFDVIVRDGRAVLKPIVH